MAKQQSPGRFNAVALVVGPSMRASRYVAALRARGIAAWSEELSDQTPDDRALEWADALVAIEEEIELGLQVERLLRRFDGPSLLAMPRALGVDTAELAAMGTDAVIGIEAAPDTVAARLSALLRNWPANSAARSGAVTHAA